MSHLDRHHLRAAVLEPRGLGTPEERKTIWYQLLGVPPPSAPRPTVSHSSGSSTAAAAAASDSPSAEGGVVSPTATTGSDESRLSLQDARSSLPTIQFGTYTGSDTSFDDSESLGRPESTLGSGSATTESQHAVLAEQLKPPSSSLSGSGAAAAEEWQTVGKRRRAGSRTTSQLGHSEKQTAPSQTPDQVSAERVSSPARVASPGSDAAGIPSSGSRPALNTMRSINRFDALRSGAAKTQSSSSPTRSQKQHPTQKRGRAGSRATSVASSAAAVETQDGAGPAVQSRDARSGSSLRDQKSGSSSPQSAVQRMRGLLQTADPLSPRDAQQVELDVNRSFLNFRSSESLKDPAILATRRRQLTSLCTGVLQRRKALSYYQGYHDVLTVLLLTLLPESNEPDSIAAIPSIPPELHLAAERLSLHWLRDAMTRNLDATMGHLRLLRIFLRRADPELADIVDRAFPLPYFALPWLITLLTHSLPNLALAQRVLDFVLVYGPMGTVCLCLAIIQVNKDTVLAASQGTSDPDDMDAEIRMHQALAALPTFCLDEQAAALLDSDEAGADPDSEDQFADAVGDDSLYDDPDVFGPADANTSSPQQPTRARKSKTQADPNAIPISRLLRQAAELVERQRSDQELQADIAAVMGPGSVLRTWDALIAAKASQGSNDAAKHELSPAASGRDDTKWDRSDDRAEYIVEVDSGLGQPEDPNAAASLAIVHPELPPELTSEAPTLDTDATFDEKYSEPRRRKRTRVRASHKAEQMTLAARTTTVTIAALGVAGVLLGMYAASNGGASVEGLVAAGAGDRAEQAREALALVARMLSLMH
ncbi:hypothetical protein V8E36_001375 [Tilletia maclaganii]